MLNSINFTVELRVLDFQMCLLNQVGYLFELIKGIILVVKHNTVEDLSQVCVQVKFNSAALVSGLFQLCLNAFEGFQAHAHLYLYFKIYMKLIYS